MLSKIEGRLRGYSHWIDPETLIAVIVDLDHDDPAALKSQLVGCAKRVGLRIKEPLMARDRIQVVNVLAIEELEAWFFGDWQAVRSAYPRVSPTVPKRAAYRKPDAITGGTWEALERELQAAGYFRTGLRKVEFARRVAREMIPDRNTSQSFGYLRAELMLTAG